MILITWNVQWCRGIDGRVDPARIVAEAQRLADFDVLCLQEVADNFPDPRLAGADAGDQFARVAELLPGYTVLQGIAVDQPADDAAGRRVTAAGDVAVEPGTCARRRRFGNLIASRLPVGQVYRHPLPYPCDPGVPGMPRMALEAVIVAPSSDIRVVTTHLEYYSAKQRLAQVAALRRIHAEGHAHAREAQGAKRDGGPFKSFPRPRAALIAGDFNFEPGSDGYARMLAAFDDDTTPLFDAWRERHPQTPRPATFKRYEKTFPGEPDQHCDFVFASEELHGRVRAIRVDANTRASDHQPIIVTLA